MGECTKQHCAHRRRLTFRVVVEPEDGAGNIDDILDFAVEAVSDTIASEGWSVISTEEPTVSNRGTHGEVL